MKFFYLLSSLTLFLCSNAVAGTIAFDDIAIPDWFIKPHLPMPDGYAGFDWNNFGVTIGSDRAYSDGYKVGTVSPKNIAVGGSGLSTIASPTPFAFESGWFTGGWRDGLSITATGYRGATLVNSKTFVVNSTAAKEEVFNWTGLTRLTFDSSGGTRNPALPSDGPQFALDDLVLVNRNVYGVFVGVNNGSVAGYLDAQNLYTAMSSNMPGFQGIVLTGQYNQGGVTNTQIQDAISLMSVNRKPDDTFVFFNSAHGGSFVNTGGETTANTGDEFLANGVDTRNSIPIYNELSDDDLYAFMRGLPNAQKWVFLDACHSGGFWGNKNLSEGGDLENLSKIALFAGSGETDNTFSFLSGEGLFTSALIDAFSLNRNGFLRADSDKNWEVSFSELKDWIDNQWFLQLITNPTVVYERAQGDLLTFNRDMWRPLSVASDDFGGGLFGGSLATDGSEGVPEPSTALLLVVALGTLALVRGHRGNLAQGHLLL